MKNKIDYNDLYDSSWLTEQRCPVCGSFLISHPDRNTCSNKECSYDYISEMKEHLLNEMKAQQAK